MPSHKLFLNLQCVVPQELKNLDIDIVTITKTYWTFREKVIRVCFYGIKSNRSHPLSVKETPSKFNIHLHPQSESFKDLYESLGYHAMDNKDPLLEELLCFMSSIRKISLENFLTPLWTNQSLAWKSNCTQTLNFFVSSFNLYNCKKYFIAIHLFIHNFYNVWIRLVEFRLKLKMFTFLLVQWEKIYFQMCSSELNDCNQNDKTQPKIIPLNFFVFVLPMLVSNFPSIQNIQ